MNKGMDAWTPTTLEPEYVHAWDMARAVSDVISLDCVNHVGRSGEHDVMRQTDCIPYGQRLQCTSVYIPEENEGIQ